MATIPSNPAIPPAADPSEPKPAKARLSKDERRELLARIERESSRSDSPERILQRAEQALQGGNRMQAERLVQQLEDSSPDLLGLGHLRSRLGEAARNEKAQANVRKAEDMLMRYIEQRKKTAAELALEALTEIAPGHPRLAEYRIWVRDLDKEAAVQRELDEELAAGRIALQVGDVSVAQRHLKKLQDHDPRSSAALLLAGEITQAEAGQAENSVIEDIKLKLEHHLASLEIEEAQAQLEELARHAVPKITLDRLNVRLEEARSTRRDQLEIAAFEELLEQYLKAGSWQKARDIAQQAGQRFPDHPRPAEMFNFVNTRESEARHKESVRQGVASLEAFIAAGNRDNAELALKLLRGKIDDAELERYAAQIAGLG